MNIIKTNTMKEAYEQLILKLLDEPLIDGTKELMHCCLSIQHPEINNFEFPFRKISETYANAELQWYWSANNSCQDIGKYAKTWLKLSDDGLTNNSAYGYILERKYNFDQIQQIIELLRQQPNSRRAVLNISDPTINRITTKDMQCTIALQFLIRDNKLHCTTYMRSNDVYFGLPYDYIYFISIFQYIANKLNIERGSYTHIVTSLHMYEKDIDKFRTTTANAVSIDLNKLIGDNYEIEKHNNVGS